MILGIYLLLRHRELLAVRWKDLWCFAGTGIGSLLLLNWTYYSAMEHASLAVAGVLLYTAPAFVMLLSALLFRERVTGRKLLALFLAFFGCALVAGIGSDSHVSLLGLLFGLGAGVSYALYSIFGRYAVARGSAPLPSPFIPSLSVWPAARFSAGGTQWPRPWPRRRPGCGRRPWGLPRPLRRTSSIATAFNLSRGAARRFWPRWSRWWRRF